MKKNSMASYASHNSFSYSSGLEIGNQRNGTNTTSNMNTVAIDDQISNIDQHAKINGVQNIQNILTNGNMVRNSEKLYINGLSNTIDNNTRGK
jgi:hypothetical protein